MPRLSRIAVRLALLYLALGTTFGALLLANKGIPFAPQVWALLPAHIEFMFLGWLTQFALGIAFWILPRFPGSAPRGSEGWSAAALILLNAGIAGMVLVPYSRAAWIGLAARGVQIAGLAVFAFGNWRRVYSNRN